MYTVILLYPDYSTDDFGHNTWMESVEAADPEEAVHTAREACADLAEIEEPEDLYVIAVIEGEHHDVNPGI